MAQPPQSPRTTDFRSGSARALTVAELARRIQGVIEGGLGVVWVVGEVSNFRAAPSGHCYFTLKDDQAQLTAVLFRSAAARLRFRPTDGLEVIVGGRVRFYGARGALQLYVESLEPRGLGALRQQVEQVRRTLAAEGLLAAERKRPLPFLPRSIGVVTALGGAAIHDILTVLYSRFPNLHVVVRPVRVQGLGAEQEISAGIRELSSLPGVEVLIVGRGGGSTEDLWAFNDEGVARAIAAAPVPVVSAVGHEIDVTIADLVADERAPTPSAAAARVVPRKLDLQLAVEERRRSLIDALRRQLSLRRRALSALGSRLRDPRRSVVATRGRVGELDKRLQRATGRLLLQRRESLLVLEERLLLLSPARSAEVLRRRVEATGVRLVAVMRHRALFARERLRRVAASLSSLSPLAVLERGYAVVWRVGDDRPLRSAEAAAVGEELRIRLARGALRAAVLGGEPDAEE